MKTKFTQTNQKFQPIECTLTLETPEDLKNFLIMTSYLSSPEAYAETDDDSYVELHGVDHMIDTDVMAEYVDSLVPIDDWRKLRAIYSNYLEQKQNESRN